MANLTQSVYLKNDSNIDVALFRLHEFKELLPAYMNEYKTQDTDVFILEFTNEILEDILYLLLMEKGKQDSK